MKKYWWLLPLWLLNGCTPLFMGAMGVHNSKSLTDTEILHYADKYGIKGDVYKLNEQAYMAYVRKTYPDRLQAKPLLQPLQMRYYNAEGQVMAMLVNCNLPGFPNMKWNSYGTFNSYPPVTAPMLIPDSAMSVHTHDLPFYKPLNTAALPVVAKEPVIVVHWSRMMGRQSKRLVEQVEGYKQRFGQDSIRVLYVNSDNLYMLPDFEEKAD